MENVIVAPLLDENLWHTGTSHGQIAKAVGQGFKPARFHNSSIPYSFITGKTSLTFGPLAERAEAIVGFPRCGMWMTS